MRKVSQVCKNRLTCDVRAHRSGIAVAGHRKNEGLRRFSVPSAVWVPPCAAISPNQLHSLPFLPEDNPVIAWIEDSMQEPGVTKRKYTVKVGFDGHHLDNER